MLTIDFFWPLCSFGALPASGMSVANGAAEPAKHESERSGGGEGGLIMCGCWSYQREHRIAICC